jgi:hypothetical protein
MAAAVTLLATPRSARRPLRDKDIVIAECAGLA